MKIAISTDHAGFDDIKHLAEFLSSLGHECISYGPEEYDADDDYPEFIFPAAQAVATGECERGIIMGGSGQGEAIAANRIPGVRCALFYGPVLAKGAIDANGAQSTDPYEIVKLSRVHNGSNMLSLAARFLSRSEMQYAIKIWLEAPGPDAQRHIRRIKKLDEANEE